MTKRASQWRFFGAFFVALLGATVLFLASVANGPDRALQFEREIRSKSSLQDLAKLLDNLELWPRWFHSATLIEVVDGSGARAADQSLREGILLKFMIDPKKGEHRRFELTARLIAYKPGDSVRMRVMNDSSGKLNAMLDRLEWAVRIAPGKDTSGGMQTRVIGQAIAHTKHWRARLFGTLTERILMNQVFYPNLFKLASLDPNAAASESGETEVKMLPQ